MTRNHCANWRGQVFDELEDLYNVKSKVARQWASSDDGLLDDLHGYGSTPKEAAKALYEQKATGGGGNSDL